MKKLIALFLCVLLCLGVTACGEKDKNNTSSDKMNSGTGSSIVSGVESGISSVVSGVESGVSSVGSKVESTVSDIKSDMMPSK